ncbi:MAG: NAD(P)/FAD-dependent oxidoreductase [Gaiellaceae bacterium]
MQDTEDRSRISNEVRTSLPARRPAIVPSRRSAEVAIVGAGVVGLSVAWHLAEAGVRRVVVIEREGVGAGASGVQPGGVRQQWTTRLNCEMARESAAFYRSLRERLGGALDARLDRCGYLFLAHSDEALERLRKAVALQAELEIPSALLGPDETAALVEGLDPALVAGSSFCAEDGYVDRPQTVVEAFAAAARSLGVTIERGEVAGVRPIGSGWRLELSSGEGLLAGNVVLAAGYDTPQLAAGLDLDLPIRKEPRYLFLSERIEERLLEPLVVSAERRFAAKHLADGRVLASDLGARGDAGADERLWRDHIRRTIADLTPRLELVSFPILVEGFYDVTPDHQALLGTVEGFPGLWLAAGFSGHGFMMAPAAGRALAAALAAGADEPWLHELSPSRFSEGRPLVERQVV